MGVEFGAVGVVVAEGFEVGGYGRGGAFGGGEGGFEAGGVGEDVVGGGEGSEGDVTCSEGGGCHVGQGNGPVEVGVEGGEHHGGAALLAFAAVAGDVGCGDEAFVQQGQGNARLVLPAVQAEVAMPAQQGGVVGNGATGGVEQQTATLQAVEEALIAQVPRGPLAVARQRGVEGDDVAEALQLIER